MQTEVSLEGVGRSFVRFFIGLGVFGYRKFGYQYTELYRH